MSDTPALNPFCSTDAMSDTKGQRRHDHLPPSGGGSSAAPSRSIGEATGVDGIRVLDPRTATTRLEGGTRPLVGWIVLLSCSITASRRRACRDVVAHQRGHFGFIDRSYTFRVVIATSPKSVREARRRV